MFLTFASGSSLAAQAYIAKVDYYSVEHGLSHRQVSAIFQDSRGFVWIGTPNGLNRFDGYTFRQYTKEKDGLPFNFIEDIAEDAAGWLWLTDQGRNNICLFHPERGEVLTLEQKFGKTDGRFARDKFHYRILCDEGAVWLSSVTEKILYRYHPDSGVQTIPVESAPPGELHLDYISPDNTIWATTGVDQVLEIAPSGKVLRRIENAWLYGRWAISDNGILALTRKPAGQEHFIYFNLKAERQPYLPPGLTRKTAPHPALVFPFDTLGTYVVHDRLVDAQNRELASWALVGHDRNNFLWRCFMQDNRGRYWLGDDFGFYILQIRKNRFQHYFYKKDATPGLGNSIRGIAVSRDKLYSNLENSGLFEWDFRSGKSRRVAITGAGWGNYGLAFAKNGDIFSGQQAVFYHLDPDAATGKKIPASFDAWAFCEDHSGVLWLGSSTDGLHTMPPDATAPMPFNRYNGFETLGSAFVLHIATDPSGILWVCANNGFYKVHPQKGVLARYWPGGAGEFYLPAENFLHFYLDAGGVFWFATSNGLLRVNSRIDAGGSRSPVWDGQSGKWFNRAGGLSNDFIYAVYEDKRGRLWLPTDNGIICLDKKTEAIKTYFLSDGLSDAEFNRKAHFQAPDGTLYFGGLNGINAFNPADFDEVNDMLTDIPLALTAFKQFDGAQNRLVDRTVELLRSRTIVLRPDDRFFNLELALLSFEEPQMIQYAWKIEGLDKDWHYQKERQINFGGLLYGTYTLRIKAQAADGQWSPHELTFTVQALPPWYLRAWFLILAALLLGAGIRAYIRWRNRQHILEQKKLEDLVNNATERIEQDKQTIEKQAEALRRLDKVKSNFFANVSHELRTPLTLILGPVNSILKSGELGNRNFTYATLIRQNGEKLLKLVGEILDLQKLESGKLELHPLPVELYPFLKRIAAQFESLAQNKTIAFVFLYRAEKRLQIEVDAAKLELVLNNLLSNAIKFTGAGGRVELKAEDLAHSIRLTVTDTGPGIHADDLPRIFDRFFQSGRPDAPAEGGTGIGLALARELSVLFGGAINAKSPVAGGKGSAFSFEFPKIEVMGAAAGSFGGEEAAPRHALPVRPAADPDAGSDDDPEKAVVLLVEDNQDLQVYVQSLLSGKYHVITAGNGQEALERLAVDGPPSTVHRLPDLIISDIMMPRMDGFQLLEKIKGDDRFRHIPVIMLTARADMQDKLRALRIGVDDYLLKPFDEEELLARVAALLEQYRERERRRAEPVAEPADAAGPEAIETASQAPTFAELAWLEELENLMRREVQNDQVSVAWLAEHLFLSERQLQRRINRLTGLAPNAYIREVRLQEARRMMEQRQVQTLKEAAWAVGLRDEKHFSQIFRERFGKSPADWLR